MATWKQVILKDPVTGEYLAPMGGNFSGGDADTLQSHPASDFLLKSEYTPVDLSEYLKTATADTKYAAANHNHNGVYAPVSHTHTTANITGLDTKLSGYDSEIANLKSSVSEGKSLVAAAVTDKGVTTAADATFQTIANNIGKIKTGFGSYRIAYGDATNSISGGPTSKRGSSRLTINFGETLATAPTNGIAYCLHDDARIGEYGLVEMDVMFMFRINNTKIEALNPSLGKYAAIVSWKELVSESDSDYTFTVTCDTNKIQLSYVYRDTNHNGWQFLSGTKSWILYYTTE